MEIQFKGINLNKQESELEPIKEENLESKPEEKSKSKYSIYSDIYS